jgi:2'-5' RNA ligase
MTRCNSTPGVIGVLLGAWFLAAPGPVLAGEHFLAIEVPAGMRQQIQHLQNKVADLVQRYRAGITDAQKKKAIRDRYHSPGNLHISLMRFGPIPAAKLPAYEKAIGHAMKYNLHQFNLADRVDQAALHVTDDGYVVYHVEPSKKLTNFMHAVKKALDKKHLYHKKSDTPGRLHISIARVEGIPLGKLRKLLEGHVSPLQSSYFPVHAIHLKVSHEPWQHLTYTDVRKPFHVPKGKHAHKGKH